MWSIKEGPLPLKSISSFYQYASISQSSCSYVWMRSFQIPSMILDLKFFSKWSCILFSSMERFFFTTNLKSYSKSWLIISLDSFISLICLSESSIIELSLNFQIASSFILSLDAINSLSSSGNRLVRSFKDFPIKSLASLIPFWDWDLHTDCHAPSIVGTIPLLIASQ